MECHDRSACTEADELLGPVRRERELRNNARDQYNRRLAKSLSPGNLPQRLAIAFNYELPIGPGRHFAENATGPVGKLLGGWQLNGVLDYSSGDPITVRVANALPLFNDLNLPDAVSGVPQTLDADEPGDQYLNPKAFAVPAPLTFGTAPRITGIRGFAGLNENLGITKRTYMTETVNVEFRFEMFNAFNRHRLGGIRNNVSDPFNFGKVTGAGGNRQGQFALKINF